MYSSFFHVQNVDIISWDSLDLRLRLHWCHRKSKTSLKKKKSCTCYSYIWFTHILFLFILELFHLTLPFGKSLKMRKSKKKKKGISQAPNRCLLGHYVLKLGALKTCFSNVASKDQPASCDPYYFFVYRMIEKIREIGLVCLFICLFVAHTECARQTLLIRENLHIPLHLNGIMVPLSH